MLPGIFIAAFLFSVQFQTAYAPKPATFIKALKENYPGKDPAELEDTVKKWLNKFVDVYFTYQESAGLKPAWSGEEFTVPKNYHVHFGSVNLTGELELKMHEDKEVISNFHPNLGDYSCNHVLTMEKVLQKADVAGEEIVNKIKGKFKYTTITEAGIIVKRYTRGGKDNKVPYHFVAIVLKE